MKVLVIEDNEVITTVDDEGKGCELCIFSTKDYMPGSDSLSSVCMLDSCSRLPCIDTVYAIIKDED